MITIACSQWSTLNHPQGGRCAIIKTMVSFGVCERTCQLGTNPPTPYIPTAEQVALLAARGETFTPPGKCNGCGN